MFVGKMARHKMHVAAGAPPPTEAARHPERPDLRMISWQAGRGAIRRTQPHGGHNAIPPVRQIRPDNYAGMLTEVLAVFPAPVRAQACLRLSKAGPIEPMAAVRFSGAGTMIAVREVSGIARPRPTRSGVGVISSVCLACAGVLLALWLGLSSALAQPTCTAAISAAFHTAGIPPRLLQAIAYVESGRLVGRLVQPCPGRSTCRGSDIYSKRKPMP